MDYIKAHAKLLLAAVTALVPLLVVDGDTAQAIIVTAGLILTGVVPNDKAATRRIYKK